MNIYSDEAGPVEVREGDVNLPPPPPLAPATGRITVYTGTTGESVTVRVSAAPEPAAPAIVRHVALSSVGPYVTSVGRMNRGENGTYNREDSIFPFDYQGVETVTWQVESGVQLPVGLRMRLHVLGTFPEDDWVSDWVSSTAGKYIFQMPLVNGHHLAYPEAENYWIRQCAVDFVVNDTGSPLPVQRPWKAPNRYMQKNGTANYAVQIQYAKRSPTALPMKPRVIEPYSTPLGKSAKWVTNISENSEGSNIRFSASPTGDVVLELMQKYFHNNAITPPTATQQPIHVYNLVGGARHQGSLGPISDAFIRADKKGIYMLDTIGRMVLLRLNGEVVPEFGVDLKPGRLKPHPGVLSNIYLHYGNAAKRAAHGAWYRDQWEFEGDDWRQVIGPKRMFEPWSLCGAMKLNLDAPRNNYEGLWAPGIVMTTRDAHEFWFADSRNNRILFGDHWTRHSVAGFQRAHFPPLGYIQVDGPIGRSTMCNFVGGTRLDAAGNCLPEPYCHDPMYVRVDHWRKRIVWTQIGVGDHGIFCADMDGSNPREILRSSVQLSYAQVYAGKGERLGAPSLAKAYELTQPIGLRKTFNRDGPIGDATCIFPMGFDFDSQGRIVWVEHYTYAIKRLDETTGMVETIGALLDYNGGSDSSGNREPILAIDRDGTCGEKDTIRLKAWANLSDKSKLPAGTVNGGLFFNSGKSMPNGRGDLCLDPNYGWMVDAFDGIEIAAGNAAGTTFIMRTKKQPTDPAPTGTNVNNHYGQWQRGYQAWMKSGVLHLALGPHGQGQTGLTNCEDLALMNDADMAAWLEQYITPDVLTRAGASMADVIAYVRHITADYVTA